MNALINITATVAQSLWLILPMRDICIILNYAKILHY